MSEKIYLGLDIGTNDVGWAVLDENHNLVRKNKFTLWGVRMFDEASDASARRSFRSSRRRIQRRKQRISLLREIFKDEINKVDPNFYYGLDDSFFKLEDKRNPESNYLFKGDFTDKDFFKKYPTIYHLRKELTATDQKADIRYIYLALHHMIKYRGNFLSSTDEFKTGDFTMISEVFDNLDNLLDELNEDFVEDEDYNSDWFVKINRSTDFCLKLQNILANDGRIGDKKQALAELFNVPKKSLVTEYLIPLLVNNEIKNISLLSPVKNKKYDKCPLILDCEDLESTLSEKKQTVPELASLIDFCLQIKNVTDYFYISKLLKDSDSISDAMVKLYETHKKDLAMLKKFFKKYAPDKYYECFRKVNAKLNNYARYIGMNNNGSDLKRFGHCSKVDFYAYLESVFKSISDSNAQQDIEFFREKIANGNLLPRQNSNQNGVIPMQLNLKEMKDILEIQKKYYEFLNVSEDGITNAEKIVKIFLYKLPYYVGPLNTNSPYHWVVRDKEKITPWNYEKVINMDETAAKFIERMQNKCTYLKGEEDYCLPKNSIIFSEYNCLSYLNKININGALISPSLKEEIFNNVFLKKKKPTKKDIINYLKCEYGNSNVATSTEKELPEINCDMSSYITFKEIFGEKFNENLEIIERIIRDIVIFEDKSRLALRLKEVYGLDDEKIKKIKGLSFKQYGSLCKNLLKGIKLPDVETGEICLSVLDVMRRTNMNLQEILYDDTYRLIDRIDEYNKAYLVNIEDMPVEEYIEENIYVSPVMKRPLIQAYKIIDEVERILGRKIDKYFVECTRTNKAEKKATKSRYDKVKDLYAKCRELALESFGIDMKELSGKLESNKEKLKSDAIYLYFTQLGKCMYTLEDIDFSKLSRDYDIDHIYPQSLIKDDSLSNRVLTKKTFNNDIKSDRALFEVSDHMPANRVAFYQKLLDLDLISREKFKRLTKKSFTSDELEGFVNRQLVVTNQAVKGLIQVLKTYKGVNQTDIVYSKAENVSMFRQLFDIPKSRTANNFHHAHDAYLNVVVGDVLNKYFNANSLFAFRDYVRLRNENRTINPEKLFKKEQLLVNRNAVWKKEEDVTRIKKDIFYRFDIHETFRTFTSSAMYNKTTILPAGEGDTVPVKTSNALIDTKKYGGITANAFPKYVIIKSTDKNGNEEYILEAIPKRKENHIEEYLKEVGYQDVLIINSDIRTNVIVKERELKYAITGKNGDSYVLKNAIDRYFTVADIKTIKYIDKYFDNLKLKNEMTIQEMRVIVAPAGIRGDEIVLTKEMLVALYYSISNIYKKEFYNYSIVTTIRNALQIFDINKLELEEIIKINYELLQLLKTNERKTADLSELGLAKKCGALTHGKKYTSGTVFCSESVTGYYTKVLFEVP